MRVSGFITRPYFTMATHTDSHKSGGSIWSVINFLLGVGFGVFALVAGVALIYGGIVIRSGGDTAPAKKEEAVASAPAAPAAAVTASTPATAAAKETTPAAGATEILIKPDATNPLMFDTKSFTVKAGQPVKLTFENKASLPQPHNWIVGKIGSKEKLIASGNAMVTDPQGMAKGYIPDIPEIIAHTKLLQPGQTETIEFTAPAEAGEYPYICSFPGHSVMMQGTMVVE